jgi:hypothetical protein
MCKPHTVGGFTVTNLLVEVAGGENPRCRRSCRVEFHGKDLNWFRNILEVLSAQFAKRQIQLALNLIHDLARNADAAAVGNAFQPRRKVDTISEDVVAITNDVSDVDTHPKLNALVPGNLGIVVSHGLLHFNRTPHGIHDARKLDQEAVPGGLDNASSVPRNFWINYVLPMGFELGQRTLFVGPHKPRVANHVGGQYCRQPALAPDWSLLHHGSQPNWRDIVRRIG